MKRTEPPSFTLEFWADENGREPVRLWLREELSPELRVAAGRAMNDFLQRQGIGVCDSRMGRHVAPGIFEFRIDEVVAGDRGRPVRVQLRIMCHSHGDQVILLFSGYDKGADPSKRRQQSEIQTAKARLTAWREAQKRIMRGE